MKLNQDLPFSIVISRNDGTSSRSIATRVRAFSRHTHPFKDSDYFLSTLKGDSGLLFSAELKTSGECVGSVRIETNAKDRFYFENEVRTVDLEARVVSICASRLTATEGQLGTLVKLALVKALYLYAHATQSSYVYAFVDRARLRLYRNLGFEPAISGNPDLELLCHGKLPMQLVKSDVDNFQSILEARQNSLSDFFFKTRHPDLKVFSSVGSLSETRRSYDFTAGSPPNISRLLPTPTV